MDTNTIATIVGVVLFPIIGFLFNRFASLKKDLEQVATELRREIEAEKDQRQKLELMIAREYVSQMALEKIMAPMQKDVNNLERMIERIANRMHIPSVGEDFNA